MSSLPKLTTRTLVGHGGGVNCLSLGGLLGAYHFTIASGSDDGTVRLWDTRCASHSTPLCSGAVALPNHTDVQSVLFGDAQTPLNSCHQSYSVSANSIVDPSLPDKNDHNSHTTPREKPIVHDTDGITHRCSASSLFVSSQGYLYEYDLRRLPSQQSASCDSSPSYYGLPAGVLNQYMYISTPYGDDLNVLQLSPDGRHIAAIDDNDQLCVIPVSSCVNTAGNAASSGSRFASIFSPDPKTIPHVIPTTLHFHPSNPLHARFGAPGVDAIIDAVHPFFPFSTGGMNYMLHTIGHAATDHRDYHKAVSAALRENGTTTPTCHAHRHTQIPHLHVTSSLNISTVAMTASQQVINPPQIFQSTITPDASAMVLALGDGNIGIYALDTDYHFDLFQEHHPTPVRPQQQQQQHHQHRQISWKDIDSLCLLLQQQAILSLGETMAPLFCGLYRGHTHSVVQVNTPAFLPDTIRAQYANKYLLGKLYRGYTNQRQQARPRHPSLLASTPYAFSTLSTTRGSSPPEFFEAYEQSWQSYLRQMFSNRFINALRPESKKDVPSYHKAFTGLRVLVTAGLDSTLTVWTGLDTATQDVYDVARLQAMRQVPDGKKPKRMNQKPPSKQYLKQLRDEELAKQSVIEKYRQYLIKQLDGDGDGGDIDLLHDKDTIHSLACAVSNLDVQNQPDPPDALVNQTNDERANTLYDDYFQTLHDSYHHHTTQFASPCSHLISGYYKRLDHTPNDDFAAEHVSTRIPLPNKPNALLTDRSGFAWVCDHTKKIYGYSLVQNE